ncbi:MAG TPA: uracil-DNA glycosylase [Acidimicrobiia bacterium]|nr:uracil-DNA glycosylase [Acidimicrobiia bacterium]
MEPAPRRSSAAGGSDRVTALAAITAEVIECRRCPRLVAWREEVAANPRSSFRGETYWGRPIPGFGDPDARVVVAGLAPAAHGGNRTGRVFTGDRSGDWLFRAMHRAGFANQPHSVSADDGLRLIGAWITAAVRCAPPANKPTMTERDACAGYLVRELAVLEPAVIVVLGSFAYEAVWRTLRELAIDLPTPRPKFGHGVEVATGGPLIVCSFHPSQQNTFTGKLTEEMLDGIFLRARDLAAP